jgi:hypothetical protein
VAGIDGLAAIVAEDEPLTTWDLDGSEVIFIPILFVHFVDAFAAEAGRQQVPVAGQLVFADVFLVEGDINDIVVGRNGVCFFGIMGDGAALFPVYSENVDKVKILIHLCIVDIQNALPDLENVTGQTAETAQQAGGASIGWGRTEANEAKAFGLSEAGSEQEFASQSGWGVKTGEQG